MPDISGFTRFIGETEIEHSTHIIKELLEIIVDENKLNMEVLEIEGDAVFFIRFGNLPSASEIIEQAKTIFIKFHQHLLAYESRRICQCGACRTANKLTLKFVIHSGSVGSYHVKDHHKIIGKDVILLHRLMKNSIPEHEYLLFTEPFYGDLEPAKLNGQNLSTVDGCEEYDSIIVPFKYISINHWLNEIETPVTDSVTRYEGLVPVISASKIIHSPAEKIISYLADLFKRTEWMAGINKIEFISNEKINQAGTIHKCILSNNSVNVFKSNYFNTNDNEYTLIEIDQEKKAFGNQFNVERLSSASSKVTMQFLIKNKPINKVMFQILKKNKMEKNMSKSLRNLAEKFNS